MGGYIVFGRNVETPQQVHALLEGIREKEGDRPLVYAVDQEGGRVARIREPLTVWPAMAQLGALRNEGLAEAVGQALGEELAALGFTMDFAPVVDVRCPTTTDSIGDRALGDDPRWVARLGGALVRGLHEAGLSACAKHFPGHGHVETDSHVDLPTCPLDEATLQQNHIAPFAASLEAGVDAVMTAHVLYPEVDAQRPATLSPTWIDGVLRRQLGFDGAVLTDDLGMGAIVKHGGIGAAAVQAIRAGVDGLLVCRHIEAIDEATAALAAEAARDESFRQRCYESLARLEDLARKRPPHPASKDQLHHHLGTPAHRGLAARLAGDTGAPGADPTSDGSHTA